MSQNLITITTLAEIQDLIIDLADAEYVAFDTETTGIEKESEIIGVSVCADIDTAYYIILSHWNVEQQKLIYLETTQGVKQFIQFLSTKKLIQHNAVFDCQMVFNNYGIDLMPSVHTDTLMLGHLLDENRSNGLKELGVALFGEDVRTEQNEMKESVHKNGGMLTKACYELYKADAELIAKYGAKDALLTLKLFYALVPELYEQGLDKFFYEEESMPLLRGPTYDLNTTGLRVDPDALAVLRKTLEAECLEAKTFIYSEIDRHIKEDYPKGNFNIGSSKQLSWLLFEKMEQIFHNLTKEGRELCKVLGIPMPYTHAAKRHFVHTVKGLKDTIWQHAKINKKTKKLGRPKKVGNYWNYIACGKETLGRFSEKYKWVEKFLEYAKNQKLLNTYVEGIESRMKYNIIRPNFLQHGTTSGRYSCKNPNFQNLPRGDKRIKSCIVSRPGNVFVGADYAQLEPRVFASFSKDERLLNCFKDGDDFYSVIGMEVFEKYDCSLKKEDKDSFAVKYPKLRDIAKVVALSATYGTTAFKMAPTIGKSTDEAQDVIDSYFHKFPSVYKFMLESHKQAKTAGRVENLFGRPRRMPAALDIQKLFGNQKHGDLKYEYRNLLNLSVNHRVQSSGASIMNRAAIAVHATIKELSKNDPLWLKVKVVLQVHDSLALEGPEELKDLMVIILRDAMENTTVLPGVELKADPEIAYNLAHLK